VRSLSRLRERVFPHWDTPLEEKALTRARDDASHGPGRDHPAPKAFPALAELNSRNPIDAPLRVPHLPRRAL